jgi:hypothetical protein
VIERVIVRTIVTAGGARRSGGACEQALSKTAMPHRRTTEGEPLGFTSFMDGLARVFPVAAGLERCRDRTSNDKVLIL